MRREPALALDEHDALRIADRNGRSTRPFTTLSTSAFAPTLSAIDAIAMLAKTGVRISVRIA